VDILQKLIIKKLKMKKFLEKYLIGQMLKSKKFWYAISSVVIPSIVTLLGVDETTASNLYYALLTLVVGQGIADVAKSKK
tara:strand:- start:1041 stop:1280 length:240 start_codon:yes stop_codon:yes gene_type:complete